MRVRSVKRVKLKKSRTCDLPPVGSTIKRVCVGKVHDKSCTCDAILAEVTGVYDMRFSKGVYVCNFDVLHLGHVRSMIVSSNLCDSLTIVVDSSCCYESEYRLRYRWVNDVMGHIKNVSIVPIDFKSDEYIIKDSGVVFGWNISDEFVKAIGAVHKNVISYYDCNLPCRMGSSDVLKYWDSIPSVVRSYFVKKVLIIGGESTGKSTLGMNLANYYNTNYLEEVGRTFSERCGTNEMMVSSDFVELLLSNKIKELDISKHSNKVMFQDTDCLTTRFYIDFLDGNEEDKVNNRELAEVIGKINNYDLILFLEPDNEFIRDGVRSGKIASDRLRYSEELKSIYERFGFNVVSLRGSYGEKFSRAVEEVDRILDFNYSE